MITTTCGECLTHRAGAPFSPCRSLAKVKRHGLPGPSYYRHNCLLARYSVRMTDCRYRDTDPAAHPASRPTSMPAR